MDFRAKIDNTTVKKYTPPTQSESIMAQQKEKNVFPIFLSVCKKYPWLMRNIIFFWCFSGHLSQNISYQGRKCTARLVGCFWLRTDQGSGTPLHLAHRTSWLHSGMIGHFPSGGRQDPAQFKSIFWKNLMAWTFSLNFFTLSGCILFISLQRITPFWRTSAKSPSGNFSSSTAAIH